MVIGVNEHGEKRFLVIEDGVGESTQNWREVLLNAKSSGMNIPELAVGDGAMGFWAALEEIYPETRQQRCWMHKTMNVLNCLPKTIQAKAKQALHAIWQAETWADAEKAFDLFLETYEPKYSKATVCLQKDREELLAFYDFPAPHWQSIRTTNPIGVDFCHHSPPDPAIPRLPDTGWHAAHDVQAGPVRREALATFTRIP